jgi:hypothetical protein
MIYCVKCNSYCTNACKIDTIECSLSFIKKQPFISSIYYNKTININNALTVMCIYNKHKYQLVSFNEKYQYLYDRFKELYHTNNFLSTDVVLDNKLTYIIRIFLKNRFNIKQLNMVTKFLTVRIMNTIINNWGLRRDALTSSYF